MSTPEMTPHVPPPMTPATAGVPVEPGRWTANRSIFDPPDPSTIGRTAKAQAVSIVIHGALLAALVYSGIRAAQVVQQVAEEKMKFDITFLANNPGPGGGGGGNPKPAPPKKVEIPKPSQQNLAPVPAPAEAPPSLTVPITTQADNLLASGVTIGAIDVPAGGGGKGSGIGTGNGSGLGPGTGGGFGGGAFRPGNGVDNPQRIREVKPQYTPEAMRAKIQGTVELEAVIGPDGKVSDVRVTRSLDKVFGLDEQARKAVFATPFIPCKRQGQPVACIVIFELQFTLR